MSDQVQIQQAGTGDWHTLTDAVVTTDDRNPGRTITIPATSEFAARLTGTGLRKHLVTIGDPTPPEGTLPNAWHGTIRTWRPHGDKLTIDAVPAATIEDLQG